MPTTKPGPSWNVQPWSATSDLQRHDCKEAEDADGDEDAFDDPGRDKSKGEDLVHPLEEREQHDSAADVRDDEEQL